MSGNPALHINILFEWKTRRNDDGSIRHRHDGIDTLGITICLNGEPGGMMMEKA